MKSNWIPGVKALVTGAFAVAAVLGVSTGAMAQDKQIKIDGSSTVYPVTEAVAEEFRRRRRAPSRSPSASPAPAAGFKKFVRGETDISDASRPILAKEMEEAKKNGIEYIELPDGVRRADGRWSTPATRG